MKFPLSHLPCFRSKSAMASLSITVFEASSSTTNCSNAAFSRLSIHDVNRSCVFSNVCSPLLRLTTCADGKSSRDSGVDVYVCVGVCVDVCVGDNVSSCVDVSVDVCRAASEDCNSG